jgi:hypothetical protein
LFKPLVLPAPAFPTPLPEGLPVVPGAAPVVVPLDIPPAELPPADPPLCARAKVVVSERAAANAMVLSFMIISLLLVTQEEALKRAGVPAICPRRIDL